MQCTGQKANLEIVLTIVQCRLGLHRHRRVVLRLAQLPFVSIVTGLRSSLIAEVTQPLLLADTNDLHVFIRVGAGVFLTAERPRQL